MKYESPFKLGEYVNVKLQDIELKFVIVTSVKFEEQGIKYDVQLPSGQKLYDLDIACLQSVSEEATKLSQSEITNS